MFSSIEDGKPSVFQPLNSQYSGFVKGIIVDNAEEPFFKTSLSPTISHLVPYGTHTPSRANVGPKSKEPKPSPIATGVTQTHLSIAKQAVTVMFEVIV